MPRLSPEQIEAFRQWSVGAVDATEHYARQMMRDVLAELAEVIRQRDEARAHQKTTADAANLIYDQESIRRLSQQLAEVTRQRDESDAAIISNPIDLHLHAQAIAAARARQSAAVTEPDETLPDQA